VDVSNRLRAKRGAAVARLSYEFNNTSQTPVEQEVSNIKQTGSAAHPSLQPPTHLSKATGNSFPMVNPSEFKTPPGLEYIDLCGVLAYFVSCAGRLTIVVSNIVVW